MRQAAFAISACGVIAGVWFLLFPEPYGPAALVNIAIPMLALAVAALARGQVSLLDIDESSKPNMVAGFLFPTLVVGLRGLSDFNIEDYDGFWLPYAALTIALVAAARAMAPDIKARWTGPVVLLFFFSAYAYGLLVIANCRLDTAEPKTYQVKALGKRESKGSKSNSYYLTVTPWGRRQGAEEIPVRRAVHDRLRTGDSLEIILMPGYLGFPWYSVEPG